MTHSCIWHDSFKCVTRLIYMGDLTYLYVWERSTAEATWPWLIPACTQKLKQRRRYCVPTTCLTWLLHMCLRHPESLHDILGTIVLIVGSKRTRKWCDVMQRVAVCCSVLQSAAVCCSVLRCVAVCCYVLQCVAMCCRVLQCVRQR